MTPDGPAARETIEVTLPPLPEGAVGWTVLRSVGGVSMRLSRWQRLRILLLRLRALLRRR